MLTIIDFMILLFSGNKLVIDQEKPALTWYSILNSFNTLITSYHTVLHSLYKGIELQRRYQRQTQPVPLSHLIADSLVLIIHIMY